VTVTTSVVVPVYNDPAGLETTVESLLEQGATGYEVVIADNGSTDGTRAVAESFTADETVRLVVEDGTQSSYAARNAGIAASTGEIIGFLDADMWVDEDYVASITEAMTTGERRYMGCAVDVVAGDGTVARYRQATGFDVETYVSEDGFAPTCCLVVRRDLFEAVGTFDAGLTSNGDLEFGRRVQRAGTTWSTNPT
jgi:glycosyltransferase involved in cell wall biosynthesis